MKKTYVKPQLLVESFAVSQNIANTCNVEGGGCTLGKPNHWGKGSCGWDLDGIILWTERAEVCVEKVPEFEDVLGICYNNPTAGLSIFGS